MKWLTWHTFKVLHVQTGHRLEAKNQQTDCQGSRDSMHADLAAQSPTLPRWRVEGCCLVAQGQFVLWVH